MSNFNEFDIKDLHSQFKQKFWDGFHEPNLKSDKYIELWKQLEISDYWLAGPLYAMYENANINYLFIDQNRFADINTLDDFVAWANEIIDNFKQGIAKVPAEKQVEQDDLNLLQYQIHIKLELITLASQIQLKKTGFKLN
jgi:hypothetical protein